MPVHFKFKLDEMITTKGLKYKKDEPSIELSKKNVVGMASKGSIKRSVVNLRALNVDTEIRNNQNTLVTITDTTPMPSK